MKKIKLRKMNNMKNLDEILTSQARRIEELKKENLQLKQSLADYQKKEQEIAKTLNIAKTQADNILSEAKVKYALECERLKVFSKKWTSLLSIGPDKLLEAITVTNKTLEACQIEIENLLVETFGKELKSYASERDRLGRSPQLNYEEIIKEEKKENVEQIPMGELEELLKQL